MKPTYQRVATTHNGLRIASATLREVGDLHIEAIYHARTTREAIVERCRYADFLIGQAQLCDDADVAYELIYSAKSELKNAIFDCQFCSRRHRHTIAHWQEWILALLRYCNAQEEEWGY